MLWLWLVLLVTLPLPFFWTEPGLAPAVRIAFLAGLMCLLAIADGVGTNMPAFLTILIAQTLFWLALLYALAAIAVRVSRRLLSEQAARTCLIAVTAALFAASLFEIYHTPHSSSGPWANLVRILD